MGCPYWARSPVTGKSVPSFSAPDPPAAGLAAGLDVLLVGVGGWQAAAANRRAIAPPRPSQRSLNVPEPSADAPGWVRVLNFGVVVSVEFAELADRDLADLNDVKRFIIAPCSPMVLLKSSMDFSLSDAAAKSVDGFINPTGWHPLTLRTHAVGRLLAGAAHEKSPKTQKTYRRCVSPGAFNDRRKSRWCLYGKVWTGSMVLAGCVLQAVCYRCVLQIAYYRLRTIGRVTQRNYRRGKSSGSKWAGTVESA